MARRIQIHHASAMWVMRLSEHVFAFVTRLCLYFRSLNPEEHW